MISKPEALPQQNEEVKIEGEIDTFEGVFSADEKEKIIKEAIAGKEAINLGQLTDEEKEIVANELTVKIGDTPSREQLTKAFEKASEQKKKDEENLILQQHLARENEEAKVKTNTEAQKAEIDDKATAQDLMAKLKANLENEGRQNLKKDIAQVKEEMEKNDNGDENENSVKKMFEETKNQRQEALIADRKKRDQEQPSEKWPEELTKAGNTALNIEDLSDEQIYIKMLKDKNLITEIENMIMVAGKHPDKMPVKRDSYKSLESLVSKAKNASAWERAKAFFSMGA